MTGKTCRTCACVVEPWALRRESCWTCENRENGHIDYCNLTGDECRKRRGEPCERYSRGETDLHSYCQYPKTGAIVGGATVTENRPACSYYVEAAPEQMELFLTQD